MPPKANKRKAASAVVGGQSGANAGGAGGIGFLPPGARPSGGVPGSAAKGAAGNGNRKANHGYSAEESADFTAYDGADAFGYRFEEGFFVPKRLAPVPRSLVEAVNDFHFAMMNDTPRNQFYYDLLESYVTPDTGVLEIGAGSGLLSMMAAKLGAKWVVAVEGSPEMAQLARHNIRANNLHDKIKVLNMLSTELSVEHLPEKPHVLVSEIFGTMLLGESALDYIADVRQRILRPDTKIIPQLGVQYAVPIECPTMDQVCSVGSWNGLNLSHVMAIKDTTSIVFTKQYGFRLSSVPYKFLAKPTPILDIDFAKTRRKDLRRKFNVSVEATSSGTAHAWLFFFVAKDFLKPQGDEGGETEKQVLSMSTNPKDTVDNFPRDMQWGQALQLIDTDTNPDMPCALEMQEGGSYTFACNFSEDRVIVQMRFLAEGDGQQRKKASNAPKKTATRAVEVPEAATAAENEVSKAREEAKKA